MNNRLLMLSVVLSGLTVHAADSTTPPKVPAFSTNYMDRSASPATNFYQFADGQWLRDNPVPADKARWVSFAELQERNFYLIHQILDDAAANTSAPAKSPERVVGDFYAAAMDTNRLEEIGFQPLLNDLVRIQHCEDKKELLEALGVLHDEGVGGLFEAGVSADAKRSDIYAFQLAQGGLSLPDRDYYLKDSFADVRTKYRAHVAKMFTLLGDKPGEAADKAGIVMAIETELAKGSRTRVELRDPDKNYNKFTRPEVIKRNKKLPWKEYFAARKIESVPYAIVGQPEFFDEVERQLQERSLADLKVYLQWHLLLSNAPFLHRAMADEYFAFFGRVLSGQPEQEPRWKRSAQFIDGLIGEALGQMYVKKYYPPEAEKRMAELVGNLKVVFRDRLAKLDWMTDATRAKALVKFDRFTQKIGHPAKFRDYSAILIKRSDYLGNVRRAAEFESRRQLARIGQTVDRSEWEMTPPTVNAYFNPLQNEIVFPAGILQPPFFDVTMDDAVNYGGIGVVIGHEMTHGYDDEGRKYDADGNLNSWWSDADAKEFEARAQKVVDEFDAFSPLPGLNVNGKLTLGENIADLGGVNIAYEALQRALAKDPSKRKLVDGFTPEQRFFISFAQIWRMNAREEEIKRRITVDPHSPGEFRATGPLMNLPEFYQAFDIPAGAPMWRAPELRAKIW